MASGTGVDTLVDIRLGRDPEQMIPSVLKPNSTVVMGGPRGWWPTKENRTAKRLERAGHHVLSQDTAYSRARLRKMHGCLQSLTEPRPSGSGLGPFGVLEAVWSFLAAGRWWSSRNEGNNA